MKTLLLIDFQQDFFPLGTVEAKGADQELIRKVNQLMPCFDRIIALCDRHPADYPGFASTHLWRRPWQTLQGRLLWPMHGVAGSMGAELVQGLNTSGISTIIFKGEVPDQPGYSGFETPDLSLSLNASRTSTLYIAGTVLEYGVKQTALDARAAGWAVVVIRDAVGCLDLNPEDAANGWQELTEAGINTVYYSDICHS